jgi:hypothetical protein
MIKVNERPAKCQVAAQAERDRIGLRSEGLSCYCPPADARQEVA